MNMLNKTIGSHLKRQYGLVMTAEQMRVSEQAQMQHMEQPSLLMTKASQHIACFINNHFNHQKLYFLIGPGNNAGDGLLAAHMLNDAGWDIALYVFDQKNIQALWDKVTSSYQEPIFLSQFDTIQTLDAFEVKQDILIIDALFGIGQRLPLDESVTNIIKKAHQSNACIISVDMPTGVDSDTGVVDENAIKANYTLTFQAYKPGHLLNPGAHHCNEVLLFDIGLKLQEQKSTCAVNHPTAWGQQLPKPCFHWHKYKRGTVAVLVGKEKPGAAILAAQAARKVCGGVFLCAPQEIASHIRLLYPGFIVESIQDTISFIDFVDIKHIDSVLIGPGVGIIGSVRDKVIKLLQTKTALVLDADVFSVFEGSMDLISSHGHQNILLTPHMGEFMRVFKHMQEIDFAANKLEMVQKAAAITQTNILLKGNDTVIASWQKDALIAFPATPWLATAGSGDVLAGIAAGMMASGVGAFNAGAIACWLHAQTGMQLGAGLIAEDLIDQLPKSMEEYFDEYRQ